MATGRGNSIVVVDPMLTGVLKGIAVGSRPWYMAMTPDGRKLYVANNLSNDVSVIDTAHDRVVKTIRVGDGPWGIAVATRPAAP